MVGEADPQRMKNLISLGLLILKFNGMKKSLLRNEQSLGDSYLPATIFEIENETMHQHYKGQHSVEHGFRFLKDKIFKIISL